MTKYCYSSTKLFYSREAAPAHRIGPWSLARLYSNTQSLLFVLKCSKITQHVLIFLFRINPNRDIHHRLAHGAHLVLLQTHYKTEH